MPGGPGLTPRFYEELVTELSRLCSVVTFSAFPEPNEQPPRSVEDYARMAIELVEERSSDAGPTVLLGHSFGVAVVIEALLSEIPVEGALLLNGFSSGEMLRRGLKQRREALPPEFHEAYRKIDKSNLQELLPLLAEYFYPRHFCRLERWPDSLLEGMGALDLDLIEHFLGTDFFEIDGVIGEWNRSYDLAGIDQPTLVVSGQDDYCSPEDTLAMAEALGDGEAWISTVASHTPWLEDPEGFYRRVREFLSARL